MSASADNRKSPPTLKTIANALGMSVSGVSIALRNDPSIPESTCQRVQAEAERQGYRRNPLVSAFCANRRPRDNAGLTTLAYVWQQAPIDPRSAIHRFYQGAMERAAELNYQLEAFDPADAGLGHERLDNILYARGIRGILLAPPFPADGKVTFRWERYAVVSIGRDIRQPVVHNISLDGFASMTGVFQDLRRLGFRCPGLVLDREFDRRLNYVVSSAYQAFVHHVEDPGEARLLYDEGPGLAPERVAAWVKKTGVDVVIGHRAGLMPGLQALGLNIPEDIGFMTLQGNYLDEGIASIQRNARRIGRTAVEMLVDELQRNETGIPVLPKRVRLLGTLAPAASLGRRGPVSLNIGKSKN
ncbi:LacI family DNA-binding transcriptional regulator [Kiritimatiellaeota bacterium B1221]|nr:LacI family DNA-binding transcriptional regulator [Kiritimatiellaeota bacterium B1221]